MSISMLFRLSGLAALVSGVTSLLAALTVLAGVFAPVIPELALVALLWITDVLTFLALFGLYGCQFKVSGALGSAGLICGTGGIFVTFLIPPVGRVIFLVGIFLLALANARTKLLPVPGYWMWLAGALISIGGAFAGLRILLAFGLILGANGRVWLGSTLWKQNPGAVQSQAA